MIGVFDSGVGGLTVVKELEQRLPDYKIIYLGDTARFPYGNKSAELVTSLALEDVKFLLGKGAKIILAACNTVSAVAMAELKSKFPDVQFFDVVTPADKKAKQETKNDRIGVIGTAGTIGSGIYQRQLENSSGIKVFSKATPLLVSLVEEGWADKGETKRIVKNYLQSFKVNGVDTFIIGCTHYPLVKEIIAQKLGKRVTIIDPSVEVAEEVKVYLEENEKIKQNLEKGETEFFVTDKTPHFEEIASKWMGRPVKLQKIEL